MNLYNLKNGQAVEVEGRLLVGLQNGKYRINGETVDLNGGEWSDPGEYVFEQNVTIERVVSHSPSIYYKAGDSTLTQKEYSQQLQAIDSGYKNSDGYYNFPDLETEYEVKKRVEAFVNKYERVTVDQPNTYEIVPVEVIARKVDTGSKFILTPLQLGQTAFNANGFFKVLLSQIAMDEWENMCAKYSSVHKMNNSDHSNIRFAQFDGKYLYSDKRRGIDKNQYAVVNDLDEAKKLEAEMRLIVKNPILAAINKNKQITIAKAEVVLSKLKTVKATILKIDPKVKTQSYYSAALKETNNLIKQLEEYLIED